MCEFLSCDTQKKDTSHQCLRYQQQPLSSFITWCLEVRQLLLHQQPQNHLKVRLTYKYGQDSILCFKSSRKSLTWLKLINLQLSGPSMQDEQREKQLNPIEYLSDTCQILKRSMYPRKSSGNDGGERTTKSSTIKSSSFIPPSPYKVDPFVNHIAPFTIFDKIKVRS